MLRTSGVERSASCLLGSIVLWAHNWRLFDHCFFVFCFLNQWSASHPFPLPHLYNSPPRGTVRPEESHYILYSNMSDAATCRSPKPLWQLNSLGQDACAQYATLIRVCDSTFTLDEPTMEDLTSTTTTYKPPLNDCGCNLLAYNLQAACGWCQEAEWLPLGQWRGNCTVNGHSYLNGTPTSQQAEGLEGLDSLDIPAWATVIPTGTSWSPSQASVLAVSPLTSTTASTSTTFTTYGGIGGGGYGPEETSVTPSGPTTSPTGGGGHPRGSGPNAGLVIGVLFLILLGLFVLGVLSAATHSFWAGVRSRLAGVQFRRPSLLPFQRPQWRQRTGLPSSSRKTTMMSNVATGTTIAGIALTYDPEDPRKGKRIVPLPYTPTISIDEQKSTTEMEGRRERGLGGRARYVNRLALWASTPSSGSDPAPGPSPTLWTPTYTSRPLPSPHSSVNSVRADPEDELSQSNTTQAVPIASKVNGAGRKQSEDSFVSQATLVNPSSPTSVLPRTLYPRSQSMRQPNIGEKKPSPRHYSLDQMTLETSREPNVTRSASLSDAPVSGRPNDRTMTEKKKQNTTSTASSCSTTVDWSAADPAKPPPSSFSKWGARNPYLHLNRHNSMPHRSTERALQLSSSSILRIKTTSTTFRMGGNPQQAPQWTVMDRVENKKGSGDSVLSSSVGGSSTPSSTPPSSSPSPTATSSSSPSSSPSSSSILHGSRHLPRPLRQHSIGVVQAAKDEATLPYLTRSSTTVVHTMSSPPETEAVLPLSSPPPKVN